MLKAVVIEVLYKLGRWVADLALKYLKKWWRKHKSNERVDKEVEQVKEAAKSAEKALKECEESDQKECRVPSEQEQKLRDATRRLIDDLDFSSLQ